VLEIAKHEWGFATSAERFWKLETITESWPLIPCVILEVRKTLKVAKVYIPTLQVSIRTPLGNLVPFSEEKLK